MNYGNKKRTKQDPFDPCDEVPVKELTSIARFSERESFVTFLENEKRRAVEAELLQPRPKKKKKLLKDGDIVRCENCRQLQGN